MKRGKIFILSGPSGSGKTTLYKRLLVSPGIRGRLKKTISLTTRSMRPGECNGRDYFFITKKMFQYKKRVGHFLESELVFGNYYGTSRKQVADLLRAKKHVLLCIDVKGAKEVSLQFPDAVKIFVKAPSMAILRERLANRGSEGKTVLNLRLVTARVELREAKHYKYVVINDCLSSTVDRLVGIVCSEINIMPQPIIDK